MRNLMFVLVGTVSLEILSCVGVGSAIGQENRDVTIKTPFPPGERPETADFYYNDRAVGRNREAFETIIQRVALLPEGTSIVWGPNYSRCGSCSGNEPGCLPKHLYPDLWQKLVTLVAERKLTLSSDYPGPYIRSTQFGRNVEFPEQLIADSPPADQKFESVLEWEFDPTSDRNNRHRFFAMGIVLEGFDLDLYFGRIPVKSRILVQLKVPESLLEEPTQLSRVGEELVRDSRRNLASRLRRANLRAAIVAPAAMIPHLQYRMPANTRFIDWQNYRGPKTLHDDVVYLTNGIYAGRGDRGVDRILQQLDQLPKGAEVQMTQYEWGGRAAADNLGDDEIERRNNELTELVPFAKRRSELIERLNAKELILTYDPTLPGTDETVLSWNSGDRYAFKIASFGRIVHHGEMPKPAALRLGWNGYDANSDGNRHGARKPESTARYTINDEVAGTGVEGFVKVIKRAELLPPGSVVQVKVCLKTKGPFVCPLIYQDRRHFERTGFEPYFGMFDWLIAVAKMKRLEIEWLPDEARSCGDCQLNK